MLTTEEAKIGRPEIIASAFPSNILRLSEKKIKNRRNQIFTSVYLFLCQLYSFPPPIPSPLLVKIKQSTILYTRIAQVKIVGMAFLLKTYKCYS